MKRIILSALMAGYASTAFAWDVIVKGPDVFGETTVVAGEEGLQTNFMVQCNSSGEVMLAITSPKKQFDEVNEADATLFFAAGSEAPTKLPAKLTSWNDNYLGIVATAEIDELMPVILIVRDAKGQIKAGAEIMGNRISDSYSSNGSTSAMNKVLTLCKLEQSD